MKEWLSVLGENAYIAEVFSIVLGTAILRYVAKLVFDRIARQLERTSNLYDDALLDAARRPIGWLIWILGIAWAAEVAGGEARAQIFSYVGPAREVAIVVLFAWFANRFISFVEKHVSNPAYRDKPVDETTAAAVGKLLRAAVIITAILTAMQTLGFSISGVLAMGGIGGIAIGFAARDLLANFFGALMIFLDRPFSVGDWVRSPDRDIEGTVEEIGWRLTRIRTFDQRPLYVPNAVFTNLAVENPSRMLNRRIYETIGVRYDDLDALPVILEEIRSTLKAETDIDQNRTLMVNFVNFGASSLDFFVYTFTKTTVWAEYHVIKERVLLEIASTIERHGGEIAFPTRTLHMVGPGPEPESTDPTDGAPA
jgi:MscS family membrane protein